MYLFPDISGSLCGILSPCVIKYSTACFMRSDFGEAEAKGLNLHIHSRTVFHYRLPLYHGGGFCPPPLELIHSPHCSVRLTGPSAYWYLQTVKAQKIGPHRSRPLLLIMNQTIFHDRTFPYSLQTSLWVFMCKEDSGGSIQNSRSAVKK